MTDNSTVQNRCVGFVVLYANKPMSKGVDEFLVVRDWHRKLATSTHLLTEATRFSTSEEAQEWARLFPTVVGYSHKLPEILPCWTVSQYTLSDPNPGRSH